MTDQKPKRPKKPLGKARLLEGKCIACGDRCAAACPVDCITMLDNGEPEIALDPCTGCKKCIKVCPSDALEIFMTPEDYAQLEIFNKWKAERKAARKNEPQEEEPAPEEEDEDAAIKKALEAWKGVWVFVEQVNGEAHVVSWQLLGAGWILAQDLGVELSAFIIGDNVGHLTEKAFGYGADNVYIVDDPVYKNYRTVPYLRASTALVRKYKPEIILMGATGLGRDLAGAVATDLRTGLTADCTGLTISMSDRLLEQTRPAFGGNIMATILSAVHRPQMASVRPHVMPKPEFQSGRKGQLITESVVVPEDEITSKVLEIIQQKSDTTINLPGARVIVSGGKGMMAPENFSLIRELADLLGGSVGCSRRVIDAGWLPYAHQVGQTGKTVKPKLYVACGISGAIQHLVGMQTSDFIIAINKDKNAPIFDVAHLGIVGDVFQILPAVIEQLKQKVSQKAV